MKRTRYISTLVLFGLVLISSYTLVADTNELASFDEAIRLNPRDAKSYIGRGDAYLRKQELIKAISDFSEAIHLNPNDALAYEFRGACYHLSGDLDAANGDYGKAIQLSPANATNYFNRSTVHCLRGELNEAMSDLNECLRLDPNFAVAYSSLAFALETKADFEKAIDNWNKYLRIHPQDANAFAHRAFCHSKRKDFNQAVKDYEEALRLDAKNCYSLNALGWLHATCSDASLRDGKEAIALATRACQITGWSRWQYLDTLAAAYAEVGDFKNAIDTQKQALDVTGLSDEWRKNLLVRLNLYKQQKPYREMQTQ